MQKESGRISGHNEVGEYYDLYGQGDTYSAYFLSPPGLARVPEETKYELGLLVDVQC